MRSALTARSNGTSRTTAAARWTMKVVAVTRSGRTGPSLVGGANRRIIGTSSGAGLATPEDCRRPAAPARARGRGAEDRRTPPAVRRSGRLAGRVGGAIFRPVDRGPGGGVRPGCWGDFRPVGRFPGRWGRGGGGPAGRIGGRHLLWFDIPNGLTYKSNGPSLGSCSNPR